MEKEQFFLTDLSHNNKRVYKASVELLKELQRALYQHGFENERLVLRDGYYVYTIWCRNVSVMDCLPKRQYGFIYHYAAHVEGCGFLLYIPSWAVRPIHNVKREY